MTRRDQSWFVRGATAVALIFVVASAPWRLAALVAETMVVKPGTLHATQGDSLYWRARAIEAQLERLGWTVAYAKSPLGGAAYGLTDPQSRTIVIDEALHWDFRASVLAHEGGHTQYRGWASRGQGEAFAEAVSAIATGDGLREHARYLAHYKADLVVVALTEWQAIYRAAALLTEDD